MTINFPQQPLVRRFLFGLVTCFVQVGIVGSAGAASCDKVRFADVNWTGESVMTATAQELLEQLGYDTETLNVGVSIAFRAVSTRDVDVFLGLWMPNQERNIRPYLEGGTVVKHQRILADAKYTLAVPRYVWEAGVRDWGDLDRFRDEFGGRVYGIEAGNQGNDNILRAISADDFGLGDWTLVQSSEPGMLAQVQRAVSREEWVVWLGWEPHPMNRRFDMEYLAGGDNYFGPDFGGANVYTITWKGYADQCPNVGRFLTEYIWDTDLQSEAQDYVINDDMSYTDAGLALIRNHPEVLERWLNGVETADGESAALPVIENALGL